MQGHLASSAPVIPSITHACPPFLAVASWVAMRTLTLSLLLFLSPPSWSAEHTVARLSFWVPPDSVESFDHHYVSSVLPYLEQKSPSVISERDSVVSDSVYAVLLEFDTPAAVVEQSALLEADSTWQSLMRDLGDEIGLRKEIRYRLGVAATTPNPQRIVAGPGKTSPLGKGIGHWRHYDVSVGLPPGLIGAIAQDKRGRLWFGSQVGGVARFDGQAFKVYTERNGLAGNAIHCIAVDQRGNVWLGSHGGGISRFDGEKFHTFTMEDGLPSNWVQSVAVDHRGHVWIGTGGIDGTAAGVGRYDGASWAIVELDETLRQNTVNAIFEDSRQHIWFGSNAGLLRYDGHSVRTWSEKEGMIRVTSIAENSAGHVWFGGYGGVARFDGTDFMTFDEGLPHRAVYSLHIDREENVWIGTFLGVGRYDGKRWETYGVEDGLPGRRVHAILQDRESHMWFGTQGGGVARYDAEMFVTFGVAQGIPGANVWAVENDRMGNLWFGTFGGGAPGGASRYDGESLTVFTTSDGLVHRGVNSVYADRRGHLWFGTWGGISRYDGDSFTNYTVDEGLPHRVVWATLHARDDRQWLATWNGLSVLDGMRLTNYGTENVLPGNTISSSLLDSKGRLWFGTGSTWGHGGGIARLDGDHWDVFSHRDGLVSRDHNRIWSIVEDKKGNIWFATGVGVSRFDGKHFTNFTAEDGLAANDVRDAYVDRAGDLWFASAGGGVTRYDGNVFQQLTSADGLASNHVRAIQDRHGSFWFGTNNGLTRFRPPPPTSPDVEITLVRADRRYEGVYSLDVPSSVGLIAFGFGAVSLKTRPEAMVYRYRLDPYHDWRTTREQQVEYQGLPRGAYSFEVEAVDRDLVYSESPAVVALTVHLPYERVGLWSGLIVTLALVGWQTARVVRRDRRLREGNQALSDANKELFQVNVDLQREQVLERLRGQAQGMQSSEDIGPVVEAVNLELVELGLKLYLSGIAIYTTESDETWDVELWTTTLDGRSRGPRVGTLAPGHPVREAQQRGEVYYYKHSEGEEWKQEIRGNIKSGNPRWRDVPEDQWPLEGHTYYVFFEGGDVMLGSEVAIHEAGLAVVRRFGEVFAFAHSRWEELKQKEVQNLRLAVEASVQRLRADVQSMDSASDFERILSLLTESLKTVELTFDGCEIDVLDEPVENPTMAHFETNGFRYTTYTLDPNGHVTSETFAVPAPFPAFVRETIERFTADEPYQALIEGTKAVLEVPAGNYGRLRLIASERQNFADDEVATLREFADAVALGYARYLDIREIQEQTERKSAFLASMSHELRTPMNAIKGFTDLVLRRGKDELSDRNQQNLQRVTQASDHLLAMINDLLDLSKIEAGRMDVNPEPFDVRLLVLSCCDTVSPLIQEGVELRQNVADDIGEANTDKARLQQMVINLLSNAIKFTDSGSVTVRATQADGQLVIALADTGKGIPADELPAIFDEYRQAEGSESRVQKGTGLGLSITKKFAELLGGTIGVESEVGKGSTFTVRVPVAYRA